ncbi:MAG: hypothetical protein E7Z90_07040 [Cyanobacteria bacterium SIG29]|nr:hypothetical protein [Cyanobacteria bacterium SIG29]
MKVLNLSNKNAYKATFSNSDILKNKNINKIFDEIKTDTITLTNSNKITGKEAISIVSKGMLENIKEIGTSIIKHPVKTILSGAIVSGLLLTTPLIGIPTAVAGSILTLCYLGFACNKSIKDIMNFVKNNKNKNYNEARKNLKEIGKDTINIGLSLPFVPKATKSVTKFIKYGKISPNLDLMKGLVQTKGIKNKFQCIKNSNIELSRRIEYQNIVDKHIKTLNLSKKVATKLKKEILAFNVPDDKIPEVALNKYAEITGVKEKPNLELVQFENQGTNGSANRGNCRIRINNNKAKTIVPKGNSNAPDNSKYKFLKREKLNDFYIEYYEDLETGAQISQPITKKVFDDYVKHIRRRNNCSPQANIISTTMHERRHIHQYARIYENNPSKLAKLNPEISSKYQRMISDMPPLKRGSIEELKLNAWIKGSKGIEGLAGTYLQDPLEIDARNFQAIVDANPIFNMIDNTYKKLNGLSFESIKESLIKANIQTLFKNKE